MLQQHATHSMVRRVQSRLPRLMLAIEEVSVPHVHMALPVVYGNGVAITTTSEL